MGVVRAQTVASFADVLDRILDKGIVIDAWMRMSVGGIDLITIEACVIVASLDTFLTRGTVWDKGPGSIARQFSIFDPI